MTKSDIVIIGGGGHSLSVADVISYNSAYNLVGFLDTNPNAALSQMNVPWLGDDSMLKEHSTKLVHVGVGQIKSSDLRRKLFDYALGLGKSLPILKSQHCYIAQSSEIGEGSLIMHHAVINPFVRLGVNAIVNTAAVLEHGVKIGDHCHIAPHSTILGNVIIGNGCFVGSGAVIGENTRIGNNVIIGAGVIIKNDVSDNQVIKL